MEKMLVTQALDERDLLKKRIVDAINKSKLVSTKRPSDTKTSSGVSIEDFEKDAKAQLQKVTDLIDRYERLDSAILIANATEQVEVAGKTMSRASAINLRKSLIKNVSRSETDFRGMLISKLSAELNDARVAIARTQAVADRQREAMTNNISSTEKKELTTDTLQSINAYCENLVNVIVDPVDAESKLSALRDEREGLIANLETAIKISNATTYVEF